MGKIEDRKFQVIRVAFKNTHKSSSIFMYVLLVFALSLASCKKDEDTNKDKDNNKFKDYTVEKKDNILLLGIKNNEDD